MHTRKVQLPLFTLAFWLVIFAQAKAEDAAPPAANNETAVDYQRMGFAPGLAAIYMFGGSPLDTVSVENGIVKVKEKSRARIGPILEAHFFVGDKLEQGRSANRQLKSMAGGRSDASIIQNDVAFGPTVLIELGDNVIRSGGAGLLFSFRKLKVQKLGDTIKAERTGTAFNLGLVGILEPNVKSLADGLTANMAVPANTTILDKSTHRFGVSLVFSANF